MTSAKAYVVVHHEFLKGDTVLRVALSLDEAARCVEGADRGCIQIREVPLLGEARV